ncbi:MAG: EndoU domain-containing protein [Crinalium sp.]
MHTFSNGVRTGNIPTHADSIKQIKVGQTWFPETWSDSEIASAGKFVAEFNLIDYQIHGESLFANYNGVRVGIIVNNKYPNRVGTIFPDTAYQPSPEYLNLFEKNPHL